VIRFRFKDGRVERVKNTSGEAKPTPLRTVALLKIRLILRSRRSR
jgi:hypothetical protein